MRSPLTPPLLFTLTALLWATSANGQEPPASAEAPPTQRLFVETQPLALAFRGASLGVSYQRRHLRLGLGGYFFRMPSFFVDQIPGNAEEGWEVAIRPAGWIEGGYTLREDGSGWLFGANLVLSNFVITHPQETGRATYQALVLIPKVAYTWIFFDRFFLTPWLGVELHRRVDGQDPVTVGDRAFAPLRIQPLPSLSLGLTF